jgi:hypothetical protein
MDNTDNTQTHTQVDTQVDVIPAGSQRERERMIEILKSEEGLIQLSDCEPTRIPSVVLRLTKSADIPPDLKNTWLNKDATEVFEQTESGIRVSKRSDYVNRIIGETMRLVEENCEVFEEAADECEFSGLSPERRKKVRRGIRELYFKLHAPV